jgi:hypothetical protein
MNVLWHCQVCDITDITSEPLLNQGVHQCKLCGSDMESIDEEYSVEEEAQLLEMIASNAGKAAPVEPNEGEMATVCQRCHVSLTLDYPDMIGDDPWSGTPEEIELFKGYMESQPCPLCGGQMRVPSDDA